MRGPALVALVVAGLGTMASCGGKLGPRVLATYSLDDLQQVVQPDSELSIDREDKVEGSGSLHIDALDRRLVRLFEVEAPAVDNALLTWTAMVKCNSVFGKAYLEMLCSFPGDKQILTRGRDDSFVRRSSDWTELRVSYPLQKGQKPDRVRLNLITESGGHIWVDDVKLLASPLPRP